MTIPKNSDYIAAINVLRMGTPIPAGFVELYTEEDATDGFDVIVLGNTSTKQVIAAFLGPVPNPHAAEGSLSQGAAADDTAILDGMIPTRYVNDVIGFAGRAMQQVAQQGYSTAASNVFVTGNSLGGLAAELAAQNGQYGGAAFGAPGIPGNPSDPSPSNFTVYVEPSDPVANFASDSPGAPLLRQANQYHYGIVTYLGSTAESSSFASVIKDFESGEPSYPMLEATKLGDLVVIIAGLREHSLSYYQHDVPNGIGSNTIAPSIQGQIAAATISDDSLDLLTVSDIFLGGGVAIDPDTAMITVNPDQTLSVSVTSTDGTRSGVASYDANDNLQGGATVGPQWDELFGVLPDFSESAKQILVDQGSTVTVTGSSNTLYVSIPPPQELVTTHLILAGNDDTVASTNSGDVVTVSGNNDSVVNQGVTDTFSSMQAAPVTGLGMIAYSRLRDAGVGRPRLLHMDTAS